MKKLIGKCAAMLAAELILPGIGLGYQGSGHQVTPPINTFVVVETDPQAGVGKFVTTGIPTVARRVLPLSPAEYVVAFRGIRWPDPVAIHYGVGNTSTPTVTALVSVGDLVTTSVDGSTGPTVALADVGFPTAINGNDTIAVQVRLPAAAGLSGSSTTAVARRSLGASLELVSNHRRHISGTTPQKAVDESSQPVAIATNGTVGFRSSILDALGAPAGSGIVQTQTGGLVRIAITGDDAPGVPSQQFQSVGGITLQTRFQEWNSASAVAFLGVTTNGLGGVWAESGAGLGLVAKKGDTPPSGGVFDSFFSPTINDSSVVAYKACLDSLCLTEGIWSGASLATTTLVALSLGVAPNGVGADDGDTFGSEFGNPVISQNGHVAFWARLSSGLEGIWVMDGTGVWNLRRIALEDQPLRGTSLKFAAFSSDIAIAQNGQVAFTATMEDTSMNQSKALLVTTEYDSIVKIARTTESFQLPQMGMQTITNINFHPGAPSQGASGLYGEPATDDFNVLAYQLVFGSQSAVVLSTVGP